MGAITRDEFTGKIRISLAHRANHKCSLCKLPTSGPSDESPEASVNIGVAAHICAASPGGPRYLATMTSKERSSITNGIWLCQNHAALIDRDIAVYSEQVLRETKRAHEAAIYAEQRSIRSAAFHSDFIAIGSELVFTGELIAGDGLKWQVRIDHFLIGDLAALIQYSESFDRLSPDERYILVNFLGDGRQLASAPGWHKAESTYVVSCLVCETFPRISAHQLRADLALNAGHDLSFTTVAGLNALPQKIGICLSTERGEMLFHPTFGTRIREYFSLFRDSPSLPRLIKLETIKQACIPIRDKIQNSEYTPLQCVSRVRKVEILSGAPENDWLPFRLNLEVTGVGPWECDIPIYVPYDIQNPELPAIDSPKS